MEKAQKYKECSAKETNAKILKILKALEIKPIIQETKINISNLYSYYIEYYYKDVFICHSNGKSTNKEYALASALAEFMERFSANFYGNVFTNGIFNEKAFSNYTKTNFDFYSHINMIDMPVNEVLKNNLFLDKYNKVYQNYLTTAMQIKSQIYNQNLVHEIFNLNKDKCYAPLFPNGTLTLSGSNGLCAGNSKEEALNEGFSELLERYSQYLLALNTPNILLPEIPHSFFDKYVLIKEYIVNLTNAGFIVKIFDASCQLKMPVIYLVLINKKTGKFVSNFGAFPVFHIAVQRCFTEITQNQDTEKIKKISVEVIPINCIKKLKVNASLSSLDGTACYNENLILNTVNNFNYDLSHFIFDDEEKLTSKDIFSYWKKIEKNLNISFWYADFSYYNFNVYYTIIPELYYSLSTFYSQEELKKYTEILNLKMFGLGRKILLDKKLSIEEFVENCEERERNNFSDFFTEGILINTGLVLNFPNNKIVDYDLFFLGAYNYLINDFKNADFYFNKINSLFFNQHIFAKILFEINHLLANNQTKKQAETTMFCLYPNYKKEILNLINQDKKEYERLILDMTIYFNYKKTESMQELLYNISEYEFKHNKVER